MLYIKSEFQDEPLLLFSIYLWHTVLELKGSLVHQWSWLKHFSYQLFFCGKTLEDHRQIRQYGIKDQSVVYLKVVFLQSSYIPPYEYQGAYYAYETESKRKTTGKTEVRKVK